MSSVSSDPTSRTGELCTLHNLPSDCVCLAETCKQRLQCQLCVKKHQHKFYLDDKEHDKKLLTIRDEIIEKLDFVKTYKKSNIANMKLTEYKQSLLKKLSDQEMFLKSKVAEESLNFNLYMEKVQRHVLALIEEARSVILKDWTACYEEAMVHFNCDADIAALQEHFRQNQAKQYSDVEKYVKFLYSDELVFRFNKQFDNLKVKFGHSRKQDQISMDWLESQQFRSAKVHLCLPEQFMEWMELYKDMPKRLSYEEDRTRESRTDSAGMEGVFQSQEGRQMLEIKIKYQNFHHIYRIARFDNQRFLSSGGRSINSWNRISLSPDRIYPLEYPTYGLLRFKQQNSTARILFGLSNGELAQIHPVSEEVVKFQAHENTIREIIQYDSNHLISASQDWTMKVWAINQNVHADDFVIYRDTLKGHSGKVYTLCKFGPNILSGGIDGTIKLWDIIRSEFDEVFQQEKEIYALRQIRQQLFVSAGEVKELRFWDYRKTKAPIIKYGLEQSCNCLLKFDENRIVFSQRNAIKTIDIRNSKEPVEIFNNDKIYAHAINHMEFLSDNQIGVGGADNFITVWKY